MYRTPDPLSLPAVADVTPGFKGGDPFTVIDHEPKEYPSLDIWPHQITFNERHTLAFPKGSEPDPVVSVDRGSVDAAVGELTALRVVNVRCPDRFLTKPFPQLKRLGVVTHGGSFVASLDATNPVIPLCPGLTSFYFIVTGPRLSPGLGDILLELLKNCPLLEDAFFGFDLPTEEIEFTSNAPARVSLHRLRSFAYESPAKPMHTGLSNRLLLPSTCNVASVPQGGNPFTVIDHPPRQYPLLGAQPQITFNEKRTLAFPERSRPDLVSVHRRSTGDIIGQLITLRAVNVQYWNKVLTKPLWKNLKRLDVVTPGEFPSVAPLVAANPADPLCPHLTYFRFNMSGSRLSQTFGDNLLEFLKNCPQLEDAFFSPDLPADAIKFTGEAPTSVSLSRLRSLVCESRTLKMPDVLFERLRLPPTCNIVLTIKDRKGESAYVALDSSFPTVLRDPSSLPGIQKVIITLRNEHKLSDIFEVGVTFSYLDHVVLFNRRGNGHAAPAVRRVLDFLVSDGVCYSIGIPVIENNLDAPRAGEDLGWMTEIRWPPQRESAPPPFEPGRSGFGRHGKGVKGERQKGLK